METKCYDGADRRGDFMHHFAIFLSPLWPTPAPVAPHTPEMPWQRQQQTNKQPETDEWVQA